MNGDSRAKSLVCELVSISRINSNIFTLQFIWDGPEPKAGQFFMIKPLRGSAFLPRPVSICECSMSEHTVKFMIVKRGRGTEEISQMNSGEKAQLTGPLGNAWADFLPENGKAALVGGGAGIAPLLALVAEKPDYYFYFYAGFKTGFRDREEEDAMLGIAAKTKKLIITAEDGRNALSGRIVDFLFEPQNFSTVFGCGPEPMLSALKVKCAKKNVPLFVSLERRMACGVGACLGCTVSTSKGNRHCCSQGAIFNAMEIFVND
ncbi:MAG: dihydroorotate dehydrogenase electron transfer subunit [Treponema sp.]|nr:dihydroorotate dehydrogenase electron transfer subunit [Treponema sp.]